MKRLVLICACIVTLSLISACRRTDSTQADRKNIVDLATQSAPAGTASAVTVTGCLTASGDQFVLTRLDKDSNSTEIYQLTNANDQLRNLVGKEVRVTGEAHTPQAAEVREITPPAPAATSGESAAHPQVSTVETTKVQTTTLTVATAAPIGDSCASGSR